VFQEVLLEKTEFNIRFVDWDGKVLSEQTYKKGEKPAAPTPVRVADLTYKYTFAGWDTPVVEVTEDKEYTAVYTTEYVEYVVSFYDWDGELISAETYHYGEKIVAITPPAREKDETYMYMFIGWDNPVDICMGNAVFFAVYNEQYINYEVVFCDPDGNVVIRQKCHYGDVLNIPDVTFTKEMTATTIYEFIGWTDVPKTCIGSATYTAKFREIAREYTVVFMNGDKVVLSAKYHYNDEIAYPLTTPVKAPDEQYSYVFAGWDKSDKAVTKDITFNAVFQEVLLEKNQSNEDDGKNKKGCGSTLLGVPASMILLGSITVLIRKKREN
jgi:hypothetical protein